jgi:hypothetical protein
MRISQTDTEVTIVFDKDSDEYKYGFLKLIDIADISNAEMVNFASEFKSLIKKADPKTIMAERWDDLLIGITGANKSAMMQDGVLAGLISRFYNQIGEAMGPVSYAGFELRQYFKNNMPDYISYHNWVDECIHAYSESDFAK